jgi:hypothetical protein
MTKKYDEMAREARISSGPSWVGRAPICRGPPLVSQPFVGDITTIIQCWMMALYRIRATLTLVTLICTICGPHLR